MLVDNEPGVLARVIGLFSGRGYNIEASPCRRPSTSSIVSRITIVTTRHADGAGADQGQLERLVPVHSRRRPDGRPADAIERELALVKVAGKGEQRVEALRLADAFRAHVVDATDRVTSSSS